MRPVFGVSYRAANPIYGLTNLKFYVDRLLAAPTLSGANVTAWNDLSGQGNHLNSVSVLNPQWSAGNGVVFTAANLNALWRASTNLIGTGAYTYGVLMRFDATNALDQSYFGNADAAVGGVQIGYSDGGVCWQIQHINVANQQDSSSPTKAPPTGTFVFASLRRPAASAEDWRVNDVAHTLASPDSSPGDPGSAAKLTIGARGSGATLAQYSNVTVAAAFLCTADIGANNVTRVETYWKYRYGLAP